MSDKSKENKRNDKNRKSARASPRKVVKYLILTMWENVTMNFLQMRKNHIQGNDNHFKIYDAVFLTGN